MYTLGHSNQSIDDFLQLLRTHHIEQIADVRRFPSSRRWPHFNSGLLGASLRAEDIAYKHFEALGGKRPTSAESEKHMGLEISWQRDYAAYNNTPPYARALQELLEWKGSAKTAVMCAEASPDSCHRSLLSDALLHAGCEVIHVLAQSTKTHRHPPSLRADDGRLIYDLGVLPF